MLGWGRLVSAGVLYMVYILHMLAYSCHSVSRSLNLLSVSPCLYWKDRSQHQPCFSALMVYMHIKHFMHIVHVHVCTWAWHSPSYCMYVWIHHVETFALLCSIAHLNSASWAASVALKHLSRMQNVVGSNSTHGSQFSPKITALGFVLCCVAYSFGVLNVMVYMCISQLVLLL